MRDKKSFPLSQVYRLLEPGPVVLLSSARREKPNVMAMSWLTMLEFTPPLVGCVISNRNFSFELIRASKECAINIPTTKLAAKVVECGKLSGRNADKFRKLRLTPVPATLIKAPLIAECYANLECRVVDTKMVRKYNLFVLEVVKAWVDPKVKNPQTLHHRGNGLFAIAGKTIKLPFRG
jgi:flavin reductase (DIM6/NTAB) family NADH-FMN oxidoreductase RutF